MSATAHAQHRNELMDVVSSLLEPVEGFEVASDYFEGKEGPEIVDTIAARPFSASKYVFRILCILVNAKRNRSPVFSSGVLAILTEKLASVPPGSIEITFVEDVYESLAALSPTCYASFGLIRQASIALGSPLIYCLYAMRCLHASRIALVETNSRDCTSMLESAACALQSAAVSFKRGSAEQGIMLQLCHILHALLDMKHNEGDTSLLRIICAALELQSCAIAHDTAFTDYKTLSSTLMTIASRHTSCRKYCFAVLGQGFHLMFPEVEEQAEFICEHWNHESHIFIDHIVERISNYVQHDFVSTKFFENIVKAIFASRDTTIAASSHRFLCSYPSATLQALSKDKCTISGLVELTRLFLRHIIEWIENTSLQAMIDARSSLPLQVLEHFIMVLNSFHAKHHSYALLLYYSQTSSLWIRLLESWKMIRAAASTAPTPWNKKERSCNVILDDGMFHMVEGTEYDEIVLRRVEGNGVLHVYTTDLKLLCELKEEVQVPSSKLRLLAKSGSCHISIVSSSFESPLQWLFDLGDSVVAFAGSLVSKLLCGPIVEYRDHYDLIVNTCRGGYEQLPERVTEAIQQLELKLPGPCFDDQDEDDFELLNALVDGKETEDVRALKKALMKMKGRFFLPSSIRPTAEAVSLMVFAVLLKHNYLLDDVFAFIASLMDNEHAATPEVIEQAWKKALEVQCWFAASCGHGYDPFDLSSELQKRCNLLLNLRPVPKGAETVESAPSQTSSEYQAGLLVQSTNSSSSLIRKSLNAIRRITDDTELVRMNSNAHSYHRQAQKKVLLGINMIPFLQSIEFEVSDVELLLQYQYVSAALRLQSIHVLEKLLYAVWGTARRYLLTHISTVLYSANGLRRSLVYNTPCCGASVNDVILQAYHSFLARLRQSPMWQVETLLILNLHNLNYGVRDFQIDSFHSFVPFLYSTFCMSGKEQAWESRFAAWSIYRILFLSADPTRFPGSLERQLVDTAFQALHAEATTPTSSQKTVPTMTWSCHSCTFENDLSNAECEVCLAGQTSGGLWQCSACTYINAETLERCEICDTKRTSPVMEPIQVLSNVAWEARLARHDTIFRKDATGIAKKVYLDSTVPAEVQRWVFTNVISESSFELNLVFEAPQKTPLFRIGVVQGDVSLQSMLRELSVPAIIFKSIDCPDCDRSNAYLTVRLVYQDGTLQVYINSFNTSISISKGPLRVAVAMQCPTTCVSIQTTTQESQHLPQWEERLASQRISESSVAWFKHHMQIDGLQNRPSDVVAPSLAEVTVYQNQFLSLLSKCVELKPFRILLGTQRWVNLFISKYLRHSCTITRILTLKTLVSLYPRLTANEHRPTTKHLLHSMLQYVCFPLKHGDSAFDAEAAVQSEMLSFYRTLLRSSAWTQLAESILIESLYSLIDTFTDMTFHWSFATLNSEIKKGVGALTVLGGCLEGLREGAHVMLSLNGVFDRGVVEFFDPTTFALRINVGTDTYIIETMDAFLEYNVRPVAAHHVHFESIMSFGRILDAIAEILDCVSGTKTVSEQSILFSRIEMLCYNIASDIASTPSLHQDLVEHRLFQTLKDRALKPSTIAEAVRIDNLERKLFRHDAYLRSHSFQQVHVVNTAEDSKVEEKENEVNFVYACGKSDSGRLGMNSNAPSKALSRISCPETFMHISSFSSHVIGLTTKGHVYTWGKGDDGRLGHGLRTGESKPRVLSQLLDLKCKHVSAGLNFSLVLDASGALWGFGNNTNGQLGNGTFTTSLFPVQCQNVDKVYEFMEAGGSHVLALAGSLLYSWGKNQYGQLGVGDTTKRNEPTAIELDRVATVCGGWEHSMAVTEQGHLYTWGAGYEGTRPVCGHGTCEKQVVPKRVAALENTVVVSIASGWDHSLAIDADGQVYTWGCGNSGALGHGESTQELFPRKIVSLEDERCVLADGGQDHSILVTDRGTVYTMGSGGPHLGYQPAVATKIPRSLLDEHTFSHVAAGDKCSFAIASSVPLCLPLEPVHAVKFRDIHQSIAYPPYPKHAYSNSVQKLSFTNGNQLRDFVSGLPLQVFRDPNVVHIDLEKEEWSVIWFCSSRSNVGVSIKDRIEVMLDTKQGLLTVNDDNQAVGAVRCLSFCFHQGKLSVLFDDVVVVTEYVQPLSKLSIAFDEWKEIGVWDHCLSQHEIQCAMSHGLGFTVSDYVADVQLSTSFQDIDAFDCLDIPIDIRQGSSSMLTSYSIIVDFELDGDSLDYDDAVKEEMIYFNDYFILEIRLDSLQCQLSGDSKMGSVRVVPDMLQRLVLTVDLENQVCIVYLNGSVACVESSGEQNEENPHRHSLFELDGPFCMHAFLSLSEAFRIRYDYLQIRNQCLDAGQVASLGNPPTRPIPQPSRNAWTQSLRRSGIPASWCDETLGRFDQSHALFSRHDLALWIRRNQGYLKDAEKRQHIERMAEQLSAAGYSIDLCMDALRSSNFKPDEALQVLGRRPCRIEKRTVSMDKIQLLDSSPTQNRRFLDPSDPDLFSSTLQPPLHVEKVWDTSPLVSSPSLFSTRLSIEQTMQVHASRSALLSTIANERFSITAILGHDPSLLMRLIRLVVHSCNVGHMEILRHAIVNHLTSSFTLDTAVLAETLYHILCGRSSSVQVSEAQVLQSASFTVGLWLLDILVEVNGARSPQQTLLRRSIVNAVLHAVTHAKGQDQVAFLDFCAHLSGFSSTHLDSLSRHLKSHVSIEQVKVTDAVPLLHQTVFSILIANDASERFRTLSSAFDMLDWLESGSIEEERQWLDLTVPWRPRQEYTMLVEAMDMPSFSLKSMSAHQLLSNVPLSVLKCMLAFLVCVHTFLEQALPFVDLSRPDTASRMARIIRSQRHLILPSTKAALLLSCLQSTSMGTSHPLGHVHIDRFHVTSEDGSKSIFAQVFGQIHARSSTQWRVKRGQRAWKVIFQGEFADDYGGPFRECIDDMCIEAQSNLRLCIPCPNRIAQSGMCRDKYVLNPAAVSPLDLQRFEFLGKLIGLAIRSGELLRLDLAPIIWKLLVEEHIDASDVLASDTFAFRVLDNVEETRTVVEPDQLEDVLCLYFESTGSDGRTYELIPGGSSIRVCSTNLEQFSRLVVQTRIHEFDRQCQAMQQGLYGVVPFPIVSLYTGAQLERLVCGSPTMDVDLLRSMTVYEGYTAQDACIRYFWTVLEHRFTEDDRMSFLRFVWGRSRLPSKAADFDSRFKITTMPRSNADPSSFLPVSHTCFFSLELPAYPSLDVLERKLRYAIDNCMAIDGDATAAARSAAGLAVA